MAVTTPGPARMLPWIATSGPAYPPAQAWQSGPLKVALPPPALTSPNCRCAMPGSVAWKCALTAGASRPLPSRRSPSGPKVGFT